MQETLNKERPEPVFRAGDALRLAARAVERRVRSSERTLRRIIHRAERVNTSTFGRSPLHERTTTSCGLVTDVFRFCLEDEAKRNRTDWTARTYQLHDIHLAAAGVAPDDPRYGEISRDAFTHGLNVAVLGGKGFLVDLSFGQFALPNGENETIKNPNSRVAKALMTQGYVPLTNDNLREYLLLTSSNDHGYAAGATLDVFDKVKDRGFDGSPRPELHPDVGRDK